uniref:CX domain-containing protein n=1 Tax=Ascaris lumbricoides TaxID=6252 RepID=A0A0M3HUJ9_ASCLU
MSLLIVSILLAMHYGSRANEICSSAFPKADTTLLLERIIENYAYEETFVDSSGISMTRKVITGSYPLKIDTDEFYVEPTFEVGECTFRFETKRFFRMPIYVHSSPNEEAYVFNRLHFRCPSQTKCCGLFCCPQETHTIQQDFIALSSPPTDSSDFRRINDGLRIERYGSIYSLERLSPIDANERVCVYRLSDEDSLRRTVRLISERAPRAIYFLCPLSSKCCQMKCASNNSSMQMIEFVASRSISSRFKANSILQAYQVYLLYSVAFVLTIVVASFAIYKVYETRKLLKRERQCLQRHISQINTDSCTPTDKFLMSHESDLV